MVAEADWTNDAAIRQWAAIPRQVLDEIGDDGDHAKRNVLNGPLLELVGAVRDRRVLDAGCGQGYLSRILASRGAEVVGVEPTETMADYARAIEAERRQGIRYVQADLCQLPDLGGPFDVVVASMVLPTIPDWTDAMRACVEALRPGGRFVFTVNHPCFEQLWSTWRQHGEYRTSEYLAEYDIHGAVATDRHHTLSTYLNALIGLGCHLTAVAEPGLDPAIAADGPAGIEAYVHLPNFLVVAAERLPFPHN